MGEASRKLEGATLQSLLTLVKTHTGITMEERKSTLLSGRIGRRLRVLGLETPEQYLEYLQKTTEETQEFVNVVTTNETVFFRTPIIWNYFINEFLPEWNSKNPGATLRIWSAASSSGEEACTIAMSCEEFKTQNPQFKYRIYGSDISTDVLEKAKSGIYRGRSMEEFKAKFPERYAKFFEVQPDGSAKLQANLLNNIEYSTHNLHRRAPKSEFYDIVFLRNVLIYFNDVDQELVLQNIYGSVKKDGILILGESESLSRLKTSFNFKQPLIYKKG